MIALIGLALSAGTVRAQEASLVSVQTPRGAKQAFILIKPKNPTASIVLFAGGLGKLGLKSATTMDWGRLNFLVRVRDEFAAQGFIVAVVDAPSDRAQKGMPGSFRMTSEHTHDIGAVVDYVKKQANLPVWLVGTSLGTFSSANGAIAHKNVDGLVLTSTITRTLPNWPIKGSHPEAVLSMPLARVTVPALIVSHKNDGCEVTPAADGQKLAKRLSKSRKVEVAIVEGGKPPESDNPCEAMTQHGFLGIESEVVARIAAFIKAN
jgi:pimeloyl-ACP methyl ester carboxylesterase